jgi:hypothetical protein
MKRIHLALLALFTVSCCSPPILASQAIRTIALQGQHAPGAPAGVTFSSIGFRPPALNNVGQAVFRGILTGPGIGPSNSEGIWLEESGALRLLVLENEQVPGLPEGVKFHGAGIPLISDHGEVAFRGFFKGTGINSRNDAAYMTIKDGVSSFIARRGDNPPGMASDVIFGSNSVAADPLFNSAGRMAILTSFAGASSSGTGIWAEQSGALANVAFSGMVVPGLPSGKSIQELLQGDSIGAMNSAGQVAFMSLDSVTYRFQGVWQSNDESLEQIAAKGQQAVGMPTGMNLIDVQTISMNSAGQVLYKGRVSDGDRDPFNDNGLWLADDDSTKLIMHSGQQAPGFPSGVFMRGLGGSINSRTQMLVSGSLSGEGVSPYNDFALWTRGTSGAFQVVAREGDEAPGLPSEYVFMDRGDVGLIYPGASLNSQGRVGFIRNFRSSLTGLIAGEGIWAQDIDGALQLIVATGMDLEVMPGDVRTVSSLVFYGTGNNESGYCSSFNDRGQLAFYAAFTDGSSGIFVSNLVAIPEPSAITLVGIPALGMFLWRR